MIALANAVNQRQLTPNDMSFVNGMIKVHPTSGAQLKLLVSIYFSNQPDTNGQTSRPVPLTTDLVFDVLNNWDVSQVKDMTKVFYGMKKLNEPLDKWNVSNVENMESLFDGCKYFNQPLSTWNVSKVTNMNRMFRFCLSFNGDITSWNVDSVTSMDEMFFNDNTFNQPIGQWHVSNVISMESMFFNATAFNQSLNAWNVSQVQNMNYMFAGCSTFDGSLDAWDVSKVVSMEGMFSMTNYSQSLESWNVSNLSNINNMFLGNNQRRDLSSWVVRSDISFDHLYDTNDRAEPFLLPSYSTGEPLVMQEQRPEDDDGEEEEEQTGEAFQVHNAFNKLPLQEIQRSIRIALQTPPTYETNTNAVVERFVQRMMQTFPTLVEQFEERWEEFETKLHAIDFSESLRGIDFPGFFFQDIVCFVEEQPVAFQQQYFSFWLDDTCNAYTRGGVSCVKGVKERMLFALGTAGYQLDNPVYGRLSTLIFSVASQQVINHYLMQCTNDIQEMVLPLEEKRKKMFQCVVDKLNAEYPDTRIDDVKTNITRSIDAVEDMWQGDQAGGKRCTRKNSHRKHRHRKHSTYCKHRSRKNRNRKNRSRKNGQRYRKR